uniref:Uncharacterized protein n=1 Tax=Rhizophora mucronata TaxID=61149 RepID=A0A2P2KCZ2_RHIMU
MEMCPSHFFS